MTSISNSLANGYYSLKDSSTSTASEDSAAAKLASLLSGDSKAANQPGAATNSYLLDLSPEAQSYLSNLQQGGAQQKGDAEFILSREQQQQVAAVLAKYKDAPFTQETFEKIQDELSSIGLSAQALAAKEQVRNVNPTMMLLNALNGIETDLNANQTDSTAKSDNYIEKLIMQWEKISTTVGDEETAETPIETDGNAE